MDYALFKVAVGTLFDHPETMRPNDEGQLVSTIGDEGLYGQACQVRTAPGGVTAAGVTLPPDVAEVVSFYGYHGYVHQSELQFLDEGPLWDYLAQRLVLVGRATDVLNVPRVQGVRMLELEQGGVLRRLPEGGIAGERGLLRVIKPGLACVVPEPQHASHGRVDQPVCARVHVAAEVQQLQKPRVNGNRRAAGSFIDGIEVVHTGIGMVDVEKLVIFQEQVVDVRGRFLEFRLGFGIAGDDSDGVEEIQIGRTAERFATAGAA